MIIAAKAIRQRQYDKALDALTAALELGEEMDRTYTTGVIEGIHALLENE